MDSYFADYDVYPEESILRILPDGIELSTGRKILFDECVENYHRQSGNTSDANLIGEKDRDDGSLMFYCSPQPVMIKCIPKSFIIRAFTKSVPQRMSGLESKIAGYGYSFTTDELKEEV